MELAGSSVYVSQIEPGSNESRFRSNSLRIFQQHIDFEVSVHRDAYHTTLKRILSSAARDRIPQRF